MGSDLVLYDEGLATEFYNPGSYVVEVRAWADNNVDTGKFAQLSIEIIDPCLQNIVQPESPLPMLTYLIGSLITEYGVQAISEPLFHSDIANCGNVGFAADLYLFIE